MLAYTKEFFCSFVYLLTGSRCFK